MDFHNLVAAAEAILFASGDPIGIDKLGEALELDTSDTLKVLLGLSDRLDRTGSALEVVTLEDAVQLCTRRSYEDYVRRALEIRRNTPLSPAAMEVLAIVAYNQPVTRGFVEQVRGIDSSSVVASLWKRGCSKNGGGWSCPAGRSPMARRPISCAVLGFPRSMSCRPSPKGRERRASR